MFSEIADLKQTEYGTTNIEYIESHACLTIATLLELYCTVGRFASYRRRIAQRISCDRFVSIFGPLFDIQTSFRPHR